MTSANVILFQVNGMQFLIRSFPICLSVLHVEFVFEISKLLFHIWDLGFLKLQLGDIKSSNIFGMKQKDVPIPLPQDIWSWTTWLLQEGLLSVISEAYVRWLSGRFQDVVVTKRVSQMGMLVVVSPGASQRLEIFLLVL